MLSDPPQRPSCVLWGQYQDDRCDRDPADLEACFSRADDLLTETLQPEGFWDVFQAKRFHVLESLPAFRLHWAVFEDAVKYLRSTKYYLRTWKTLPQPTRLALVEDLYWLLYDPPRAQPDDYPLAFVNLAPIFHIDINWFRTGMLTYLGLSLTRARHLIRHEFSLPRSTAPAQRRRLPRRRWEQACG